MSKLEFVDYALNILPKFKLYHIRYYKQDQDPVKTVLDPAGQKSPDPDQFFPRNRSTGKPQIRILPMKNKVECFPPTSNSFLIKVFNRYCTSVSENSFPNVTISFLIARGGGLAPQMKKKVSQFIYIFFTLFTAYVVDVFNYVTYICICGTNKSKMIYTL